MTARSIKNRQPKSRVRTVHESFTEFEELQESARHWDLDFRQLDAGPFCGEVGLLVTPEVHVGRVRLERCIEQTGAPPSGLRTFAVPADPATRLFWRGRPVAGREVLVYPRGSEIDAISQPGFDMYVLSFSEEVLGRAGEAAGIADLERRLDASDVVRVNPHRLWVLRRSLAAWFGGSATPGLRQGLQGVYEDLPTSLVRLLADAPSTDDSASASCIDRAIRRVREHVAARPFDALRVRDVARHLGISERTLRHSFRNRLGLSPKAYLRDRRLNLVRRELRRTDASRTKVSDVAHRCGFRHMGQFAADYQRLFGELPSETLSRQARPRGSWWRPA